MRRSGEVNPMTEFFESVADFCQKHLIVHLICCNICLVAQQASAEDQLLEGLKRSSVWRWRQTDKHRQPVWNHLSPYLTDWLLQVISPDVDMSQAGVEPHSLSQSQQSLRPDVVPADRQTDERVFEWVKNKQKKKWRRASGYVHGGSVWNSRFQTAVRWG